MMREQQQPRPNRRRPNRRDERPARRRTPDTGRSPRAERPYTWDEKPISAEDLEAIRQQREARMYTSQQHRQQKARQEKRKEQQVKRRKQKRKTDRWEKRQQENQRAPAKPLARRKLVIKLVTALAVVLALTLGMTIFFKVGQVQVTGNVRYSAQEIIEASGIEAGENLLTFGRPGVAGRILAELPYVGDVQIGIKLPDTVNIDIVELTAAYGIQDTTGQWWLMDSTGKLLQKTDETQAQEHIRIVGIRARGAAVGQHLTVAPEEQPSGGESETDGGSVLGTPAERAEAVLDIMAAIAAADRSGEITVVDVTSLYDLQVHYGDDFQVLLSGPTDLGYKVRYMVQAIEELMNQGYRGGVLDLSFRQTGKAIFTPW